MAIPKVFVSSTCYDLKYIRENLKYFIKTLGYEPILSEDGGVFYNPRLHTHDACLAEVPNCHLFVLIIGGRFGGGFKDEAHSITNAEFKEAIKLKIPIFALVESNVYHDHHLYSVNKKNKEIDYRKIEYPSIDSTKICDFIDEVRSSSINNAIVSFHDYSEIETYLRTQWAGMLCEFLTKQSVNEKILDTMTAFSEVNKRIEILSKQILESVGSAEAKIEVLLYNEMINNLAVKDLGYWGAKVTPKSIMEHPTLKGCAKAFGGILIIDDDEEAGNYIGGGNWKLSAIRYSESSKAYVDLRKKMIEILTNNGTNKDLYAK